MSGMGLDYEFLGYEVLGNTVESLFIAFAVFVVSLLVSAIFQYFLVRYAKRFAARTATNIDDTFVKIIASVRPPFYFFLSFYIGLNFVAVHALFRTILTSLLIVWVVYLVVRAVQIFADYVLEKGLSIAGDPDMKGAVGTVSKVVKFLLWAIGALFVFSNLGVNISSVLAGLGIGGIAIALALQNILGDLFSSFAILFDKPFVAGDFVVVGEHRGVVEKIGIKTTRLRALSGEEIVISNKELTSARVQNFRRMEERRAVFSIGVVYGTPTAKLGAIPKIVEGIISQVKHARFSRCHFKEFGDYSLNYEVVYFVDTRDYAVFMDIQQEINLALYEAFAKKKIEFAYPTQVVYHGKLNN
jgi:small-conductance mechanosensitive channel